MASSIATWPNALTGLRALGIPLFVYLALGPEADGWAIAVLAVGGATDYFDGKLARALGQESKLGEILDPTIDRLYILATLIVLYMREAIPLWLIAILIARDAVLALLALALAAKGKAPLKVTFVGKAATFNLLYAFPFLLLALSESLLGEIAFILGWAFAIWGVALYVATGISYFLTALKTIRV
jgi:cardiolipin synthase